MARTVRASLVALWVGLGCAVAARGGELPDIFSLDAARFRADLSSALWEVRIGGVQGLSYLRHHSFEADLIRALGDGDARVRREAALGLARLGRRASVPPLIDLLADDVHQVRSQAALALARITNHTPPPAARDDIEHWRDWWNRLAPDQREQALIARLSRPEQRTDALRSLRRLGGSGTEAALLDLAEKGKLPRAQMRLLVEALEPVATRKSLGLLKRFCPDVPAATWALGNIGGPEAEQILLDALRGPQLDVLINLDRTHSTGAFRHAPVLIRAFGLPSYRWQPDDLHYSPTPVQRLAARLLIRTGRAPEIVDLILSKLDGQPVTVAKLDDPTIQALQRIINEMDPELQPGFHRADAHAKLLPLGAMPHLVRDPALAGRLIALLEHPAYVVRVYAATTLGRLRAHQAVRPIAEILHEGYAFPDTTSQASGKHGPKISRFVRWKGYLAIALGHIGDDAARKVLEQLLVDRAAPRDIRFGAAVGLGLIGSEKSRDALTKAAGNDLVRWIRQVAARSLREIETRQRLNRVRQEAVDGRETGRPPSRSGLGQNSIRLRSRARKPRT